MNLILLFEQELAQAQKATSIQPQKNRIDIILSDHRATHIINVIKPNLGEELKVGILNAKLGYAEVKNINAIENNVTLSIDVNDINKKPPSAVTIKLIIALPRPKAAKRIIRLASECGIKEIHFIHSYRVEKSYWSSPLLHKQRIEEQLLLGLEQSIDTQLAKVFLHQRFKPFVEDQLPRLIQKGLAFVLHPYSKQPFHAATNANSEKTTWLIVGPEGGFIDYEVDKFIDAGCQPVTFGQRILRTETIIPMAISALKRG